MLAIAACSVTYLAASQPAAQADPGCNKVSVVPNLGDSGDPHQLRAAIANACQGGTVVVAPGTVVLTQGELFLANRTLNIVGAGFGATPTVVVASASSRVFDIYQGNVVLANLVITGGNIPGTQDSGGGVQNTSAALALVHTTVSGNTAHNTGGGIENTGLPAAPASLTLAFGSIVSGNASGTAGGGVANVAAGGDASVTVLDTSSIANNTATGAVGGGVLNVNFASGGNATVTLQQSSAIANNTAAFGGGVFNDTTTSGTAVLTLNDTSSVHDNTATSFVGGGIDTAGTPGGPASVVLNGQSSVTRNRALFSGGGIWIAAYASVTLNGGTVTANVPNDCGPGPC